MKKSSYKGFSMFIFVTAIAVFLAALCGCTKKNELKSGEGTVITDMAGREVEIEPESYSRVVCIGAGALRLYCYVCNVDLLCGVEDIDNEVLKFRPKMFDGVDRPYVIANRGKFSTLPSCGTGGPNAQTAEAERILSCNPDIVISAYEDRNKSDALQNQLGIPVIKLATGKDGVFDPQFSESAALLGKIFGTEKRVQALLSFIENEKNEIQRRTSDIPEGDKKSVYICGLGNWGTTNHLMTSQNYVSFNITGIKNAVSGLASNGVCPIEKEKFESLAPAIDVMIIDSAAVKNIQPLLDENPDLFGNCRAWKENQVFYEYAFNAYYTNYEVQLLDTWLCAKYVYPEKFSDIDISKKTDEIMQAFLSKTVSLHVEKLVF